MLRKFILLVLVAVLMLSCGYQSRAYALENKILPNPQDNPLLDNKESEFFLVEGEEVVENIEEGYWMYRSPELFVEVNRVIDNKGPNVYYVAEVRLNAGETERAGFAYPKKPGKSRRWLSQIATDYQSVISINADYMSYELKRKGIIIRDGKTYSNRKNADTLAFYPDGSMRILRPKEKTSAMLLKEGVRNTFSFGPTLINNGVISSNLNKHRLRSKNPRTAVGMVEPYHYILIVVNGRQKNYSVGMTLQELAELFKKYNCQVAYNLDGGRSSVMCFMGKHISYRNGSLKGQRKVPDALMFGFTQLLVKK